MEGKKTGGKNGGKKKRLIRIVATMSLPAVDRPLERRTLVQLPSHDESQSRHTRNFSVLMSLSLDFQEIFQSRWVSVSISKKFLSLDESRSQHPRNSSVSVSTSNKFASLDINKISFPSPLMGSQISARLLMESQYRHLWPSLVSETWIFLVSVLSLRLRHFQSRSHYWDSDIFSLGLGLDDPNLVSLIPAFTQIKKWVWH